MKICQTSRPPGYMPPRKQRGIALFIALVALVTLMLAAVALIRSVDTSTVIAGNLAFKQAATVAGDAGVAAAKTALTALQAINQSPSPWDSAANGMNISNATTGYYSNADPNLNLLADATWTNSNSVSAGAADASGNSSRYLIQRMCRDAGVVLSLGNCLFNYVGPQGAKGTDPSPVSPVRNVLYRVTVRITGPRNTISYIQAFIY